jgi:hypothetical protein
VRIVLAVASAAAVAAVAAQTGAAKPGPQCGGTLWKQMTLVDNGKGVNGNPAATSIGEIAKLTAPARVTAARTTSFQKRVWQMGDVVIDSFRVASNGEIVLKLYDIAAATYMNAYLPAPARMTSNATLRKAMVKARNGLVNTCPAPTKDWQLVGAHAALFGVGFWNPVKTTAGALKNGAELRPLVGLTVTQGCGKG